tara:strand:- start:3629 stop:4189 length:561 start_codon:yes stop_codon:yes gene_type:complete
MCLLLREAMTVGRIAISQFFFSVELEKLEGRKRIKDELLNVRNCTTRRCVSYLLTTVCLWQYCVVTEAPKTTFGKVRALALRLFLLSLLHAAAPMPPRPTTRVYIWDPREAEWDICEGWAAAARHLNETRGCAKKFLPAYVKLTAQRGGTYHGVRMTVDRPHRFVRRTRARCTARMTTWPLPFSSR